MILDLKANPSDVDKYDVFDKATGENIGKKLAIYWADDEVGVIRYYPLKQGFFHIDPDTNGAVSISRILAIEIRPKEGLSNGK